MNNINYIRRASIWIFILPILAINLCLYISINYHLLDGTFFAVDYIGRSGSTIPYIDGGVSISRVARTFPTFLIFKPAMFITAYFLFIYWKKNNILIQTIEYGKEGEKKYFLIFGITSAIFLIFHSIFLGVKFDLDLYKFFRRFILIGFIIFELVAQTLLVLNLIRIKNKISKLINVQVLFLKITLVSILSIVAIISLPTLSSSGNVHFKHALEWNYFIGIVLFYLLSFLFWKKRL